MQNSIKNIIIAEIQEQLHQKYSHIDAKITHPNSIRVCCHDKMLFIVVNNTEIYFYTASFDTITFSLHDPECIHKTVELIASFSTSSAE